ncbi:psbP domain-containing protein 3, chloroplastic [Daucus carota subsp. sativus]|uniref:psbP domain-containing protein 3, chloroplastic n=1 Tax=Daucus carota subsp. sativus TaxID=79200 RepID=UPI0007F017F9|nr:PREDICTED: psbP domain-containing protein 3, chloroplastic [Daucus carota subsp. sativus]
MAVASSLQFIQSNNLLLPRPQPLNTLKDYKISSAICCKNAQISSCAPIQDEAQIKRREALFQTVFAAFSLPSIVPLAIAETAVAEEYRTYSDDVNKFKISIPQDWEVGTGDGNGLKSVTAFYPAEASSSGSSVSVVITGLGPDFTKLESFGNVDAFAENLVSGLDRSWQRPPGVKAVLLNSKSSKGFYFIEYTLKNPGESERHLFSVLGVANNGWYNRLYTLTGQFVEEDAEKYGSKIQKVVSSFRFI